MEVIRDISFPEVERDGVKEGAVGEEVEAVDPRKGEPDAAERLSRRRIPAAVDVLLPSAGGGKGHKAQGCHDGLQLLVGYDGLKSFGVPQS